VVRIGTRDSIAQEARRLKHAGKTVVFTNGCFDILHPGHIDLLRRARGMGDALIVGVNSDASVRRLKGAGRPIFSELERSEVLAATETVDHVCIFDEDTPLETILSIRPDVLVKGSDWGLNEIVGRAEVEGWGGKVVAMAVVEGHSTTSVIERVLRKRVSPSP
jgi:rfaE bifunctional protein nucleotidyltransferase chain/domain